MKACIWVTFFPSADIIKSLVQHKWGPRAVLQIGEVAGSIPAGVSEFFIDMKSLRSHYGPGIDSASNRNEYQENFLRVRKVDNLTSILYHCHVIWEP